MVLKMNKVYIHQAINTKLEKKLKKSKYYIFIGDMCDIYIFTSFQVFYIYLDDGPVTPRGTLVTTSCYTL